MRFLVAACCWMACAMLHAAPLEVRPQVTPASSLDDPDRFPWVTGGSAQIAVVTRINTLLWAEHLDALPPSNTMRSRRKNSIGQSSKGNVSNFSYEVLRNDDNVLSIAISAEGCSAYCELFTRFHAFETATGRQLQIDDLLTPTGQSALTRRIQREREVLITKAIAKLERDLKSKRVGDESFENMRIAIDLYRDCLSRVASPGRHGADGLGKLRVETHALAFVSERYSNHAMRALDKIGDFKSEVAFSQLESFLTPYGKRLLLGIGAATTPRTPFGQVLNGLIDGRLPITLVLETPWNDNSISASYFYRRFGQKISLSGRIDGFHLKLEENGSRQVPVPRIEATMRGDTLTGQWIGSGKSFLFQAVP